MEVIVLVLVIIAALFAIVSGVWVAIALVHAISADRTESDSGCPAKRDPDS
ncbi:MAG: hypothetical protein ACYS6W_16635 [Planctomycetota bacterium]|jgi:hypothetical protein